MLLREAVEPPFLGAFEKHEAVALEGRLCGARLMN